MRRPLTEIQIQFSTREGLVKTHNEQASDRTMLCWMVDYSGALTLPSNSLCCSICGWRPLHLIVIKRSLPPQPAFYVRSSVVVQEPFPPMSSGKLAPHYLANYLDFGYSHPQGGDEEVLSMIPGEKLTETKQENFKSTNCIHPPTQGGEKDHGRKLVSCGR